MAFLILLSSVICSVVVVIVVVVVVVVVCPFLLQLLGGRNQHVDVSLTFLRESVCQRVHVLYDQQKSVKEWNSVFQRMHLAE